MKGEINMCKKNFILSEMNEENYNLIVSNVILSQTKEFTYLDIINNLKNMFKEKVQIIERVVKNCLIRLRDDGYLRVLGCKYSVVELAIL